jgi:ABC-2 type transport system ATP-binding protein
MENAITARGLTKRFGTVVALDHVDLDVARGTVVGLLGPNGAGKTTAVRILTTILPADEGEAHVLGIDVHRHPDVVRASIGLAGQYAAVDDNLTGRENLRMIAKLTHLPPDLVRRRPDELLERFSLTDAADRPSRTYSGGMRRRLDLAAALVHRPPVLFLDEPSSGLDPASRTDLWTVIEELVADGTTVLLTTQYLEEADRLADRIVVVDGGRVIEQGTAAELKARLGETVLELTFVDEPTTRKVRDLLRDFAPESDGTNTGLIAKVAHGAKTVMEILRLLDDHDVEPTHFAVREPSLDDVFLTLTGHTTNTERSAV